MAPNSDKMWYRNTGKRPSSMRLHATLPGHIIPTQMHLVPGANAGSITEVTLSTQCGSQARVIPTPWEAVDPALATRLQRAAAIARDTNHPVTHLIQAANRPSHILYACPVRQRRGRTTRGVLVGAAPAPAEHVQLLVRAMLTPPAQ